MCVCAVCECKCALYSRPRLSPSSAPLSAYEGPPGRLHGKQPLQELRGWRTGPWRSIAKPRTPWPSWRAASLARPHWVRSRLVLSFYVISPGLLLLHPINLMTVFTSSLSVFTQSIPLPPSVLHFHRPSFPFSISTSPSRPSYSSSLSLSSLSPSIF